MPWWHGGVKGLTLSLPQLRLLLWHRFNPWPENLLMPWRGKKKKRKKEKKKRKGKRKKRKEKKRNFRQIQGRSRSAMGLRGQAGAEKDEEI